MRIPLLAGRYLTPDDRKTAQKVVVINEQFRKEVFGGRDPIGQRLTFDFQERQETENYQAIVVGVTGDVHHANLATAPFREAYIPVDQSPLLSYDIPGADHEQSEIDYSESAERHLGSRSRRIDRGTPDAR